MPCSSCGADLPRDAAYCLRCGARVELGSVLGVGTDLPPVPPRGQPTPAQPPAAQPPAAQPSAAPSEATHVEPDDLSKTAELPRLAVPPQAPAQAPPASPQQGQGRPTRPPRVGQTLPPPPPPAPATPAASSATAPGSGGAVGSGGSHGSGTSGGSGHSRGSVMAMVATFLVLTIIGTFALTRILGSDDPAPVAATPSVSSEEGEPSTATSPSNESSDAATTAPQSTSPSPSTSGPSIPAGARQCSTSGSDSVATAYAATERTSCEFAGAVREAYRKAGTPEGATTLRAFSPVTKKWYSLSCDGGAPIRCTSTTNAVVLLAP